MQSLPKISAKKMIAVVGCVLAVSLIPTRGSEVVTAAATCSKGGPCKIGDGGPLGGIVYYAAPEPQWWGQYLEVLVSPKKKAGTWGAGVLHAANVGKVERILGKQLGAGRKNTELMVAMQSSLATSLATVAAGAHIPSKDELDALYNYIATSRNPALAAFPIGLKGSPYWTSSEASEAFAWYQLFQDGTQFTDANGIVTGLTANKNLTTSNAHKGSSFQPTPMRLAWVHSFAPRGVALPTRPANPTIPPGGRTSEACSAAIRCSVGDRGPGGGVVFYDAGSTQSWGRWLEAAPANCQKSGLAWRTSGSGRAGSRALPPLYPRWETAARQRVESKRMGMGRANTDLIVKQHKNVSTTSFIGTAAGYADTLVCGEKDDWFLPSKDELDTLYNVLALTDNDLTGNNSFGFSRGFYWTSSEYNNETAWTQLWIDGQQFDREKWLTGDPRKDGGFNPFHVRPIRAFG